MVRMENGLEVTALGALDFNVVDFTFHQKPVAFSASNLLAGCSFHEVLPSIVIHGLQVWAS